MTTALYRRYRPGTFAEVIGQDHVTAPLRQALRSGQVNHAYLFSGPRGCGKTSSARILARALNCARNTPENPTDTPCGECESCVELATGGPGSLDVVEIDAASHGGVDDARELRERATFAPARDRYKVFILDEAHMVSHQGFNALLKIVEEPPAHVKFIFATTEPEKVIGTIRSRTHHYPFRLVPPDVMVPFLEQVMAREGVPVGAGVLSLVVRAGGGSVRDSLSVLDQLVSGAGPQGLEHDSAVALLGYTPGALLDDLVDAVIARDGAAAFRVVERVVDSGHEPRRFVEDLLGRFRDLIVMAAAGDQANAVLRDTPGDQLERMRAQAMHLGAAEMSRSADLTLAGLGDMVGATSPRLHLELLAARLLLPGADDSTSGLGARLDRVERVVSSGAAPAALSRQGSLPPASSPPPVSPLPVSPPPASRQLPVDAPAETNTARAEPSDVGGVPTAAEDDGRTSAPEPEKSSPTRRSAAPVAGSAGQGPSPAAAPDEPVAPAPAGRPTTRQALDTEMLRRRWPDVLATVQNLRKLTAALVVDNALPLSLDDTTLRLGFTRPGHVSAFRSSGHADIVARALRETLGVDVSIEAVLSDPGADASAAAPPPRSAASPAAPSRRSPDLPTREQAEASWGAPGGVSTAAPEPAHGASEAGRGRAPQPGGSRTDGAADRSRADEAPQARTGPDRPPAPPAAGRAAAPGGGANRDGSGAGPLEPGDPALGDVPPAEPPPWDDEPPVPDDPRGRRAPGSAPARRAVVEEDEPSPSDPDLAGSGLTGAPLVAQMLGGRVIDEIVDDGT